MRRLFSIAAAAKFLGLPSAQPIYYAHRSGRLPFVEQIGRVHVIPGDRLEDLLRVIGPQLRAVDYVTAAQRVSQIYADVIEV